MQLTQRKIERLSVENGARDRLVFDEEQRGLAVRVTSSGGRTYLCQYTLHGIKRRVPLGGCSALSLSKAREAAAIIMGEVAKGRDPACERKEAAARERLRLARNRLTLETLIGDWEREHLADKRPRYAAEAVRALRHAFTNSLALPADDLDRAKAVHALESLKRHHKGAADSERKRHGGAMASRTAAYGRAAYAWAIKRGAVQSNPFIDLPIAAGAKARDRVLSDQELVEVWRALEQLPLPYSGIVRMLVLSGQRKTEVTEMSWAELSTDLKTWTIPSRRTKNGVSQIVPLSNAARAVIRGLLPEDIVEAAKLTDARRAQGSLVFPGIGGKAFAGWSKSKRALDQVISTTRQSSRIQHGEKTTELTPWRLHDLRRTLATGLQRLGVRLEVTEAVLNHISGSRAGVAGIYQRHDWLPERRAALDAWATHLAQQIEGSTDAPKVVALRR